MESDTVVIAPSRAAGSVPAPPAKSLSHRLLLCAALAEGRSRVRNVGAGEDVEATLDCLRALGAAWSRRDGDIILTGLNPFQLPAGAVLPCRESGSTLRFLIPLCLLGEADITFELGARLRQRPLGVYAALCRERRLCFAPEGGRLRLRGPLGGGTFTLPGDVSSQFVTGLLLALPLLGEGSLLRLTPPVESRPYIDLTLGAMEQFGVKAKWLDGLTLAVPGGQRYRAGEASAEGDWSNAAPLLALGAEVTGLDPESRQGDRVCRDCFAALDRGFGELDLAQCPDLGPLLFVYAALGRGGRFTGVRRLRDKESDRIAVMAAELSKVGSVVKAAENSVTVFPLTHASAEAFESHGDHRVAMALAVLCARTGGTLRGARAVNKSFPDFFQRLRELGIELREEQDMDLEQARREIAAADREMAALFQRRMAAAAEIAAWKKARSLPVRDEAQEARVLERNLPLVEDPALRALYGEFLEHLMGLSRRYQAQRMEEEP